MKVEHHSQLKERDKATLSTKKKKWKKEEFENTGDCKHQRKKKQKSLS